MAYIFAINQNFPSFPVKNGPDKKKGQKKTAPIISFLFSLNLLLSLKAKNIVSSRKRRQQTGLKALF